MESTRIVPERRIGYAACDDDDDVIRESRGECVYRDECRCRECSTKRSRHRAVLPHLSFRGLLNERCTCCTNDGDYYRRRRETNELGP